MPLRCGGGILLQKFGEKPKLHPGAFFSQKLSPAERNYNRQPGAPRSHTTAQGMATLFVRGNSPIIIFTDHKNFQYIKKAKRLKSSQASWDLFFTRFAFTISYQPGSKNTKAEFLS